MRLARGLAVATFLSGSISAHAGDAGTVNGTPSSPESDRQRASFASPETAADPTLPSHVGTAFLSGSTADVLLPATVETTPLTLGQSPAGQAHGSMVEVYTRGQNGIGTLRAYVVIQHFHESSSLDTPDE